MSIDPKHLGAQSATAVESAGSIDRDAASHAAPENPPAFPELEKWSQFNDDLGRYEDHYAPMGGMSLGDYFAAKVLGNIDEDVHAVFYHVDNGQTDAARRAAATVAETAYVLADAMLKAREGR